MLRCLARTIRNAVFRAWYSLNIEHKGAYSFERLRSLHQFINLQHPSTSPAFINVMIAIATPLPCFLLAIGSDALPLNRPDEGPQANGMFWVRSWLVMTVFTVAVLIPLHHPDITSIPNRRIWLVPMSIVIGAIHTGFHYLAALTIGFPVPFSNLTLNVVWISLIICGVLIYMGPTCRRSPLIRQQLKLHAIYTYGASNLAVVYPLFYYAFLCVRDIEAAQLLMAFSLPILKTMEKHLLYHVTRHVPDLQPVMLVFNVEVFNALFVSSCMRNSTSPSVTISLMVADFLGACAALYGLRNIMTRLDQFVLKMGLVSTRVDILDIAAFIASQQNPDTQQLTRNEPPISAVKIAWGKHRQSWKESSVVPTEGTNISSFNQSPSVEQVRAASVLAKHVQELTLKERLEFVHEMCRVLRRVEFLLLVEYTEVMVPMTYGMYPPCYCILKYGQ
eukprot:jgi/Phyca11/129636/e_gw1.86.163.1